MKYKILSASLLLLTLTFPPSLLGQDFSLLGPMEISKVLTRPSRVANYVNGVVNRLEEHGWRKFQGEVFSWDYLLGKEISIIEVRKISLGKDELIPRVALKVKGLLGDAKDPKALLLSEFPEIKTENLLSLTGQEPLIMLNVRDLAPLTKDFYDVEARRSNYSKTWWSEPWKSRELMLEEWKNSLEGYGWLRIDKIDRLQPTDLVNAQVAFASNKILTGKIHYSLAVKDVWYTKETGTLLSLIDQEGRHHYLNNMQQDQAGEPMLYLSRPDIHRLIRSGKIDDLYSINHFAELGFTSERSIMLVVSLWGGLDAGLPADESPFSAEMLNRLRRLKGLKFAKILVLFEENLPLPYLDNWLNEIRSEIFPEETARNPQFIQLYPRSSRFPRAYSIKALERWVVEANEEGIEEIFLVEENEDILQKIEETARYHPVYFKRIKRLTLIHGGTSQIADARYTPKGISMTQEDFAKNSLELLLGHLIQQDDVRGLANVDQFALDSRGEVIKVIPEPGLERVNPVQARRVLTEILDGLPEQAFADKDKYEAVALVAAAMERKDLKSSEGTLDFMDDIGFSFPLLPEGQKLGVLRLAEALYGSDAVLGEVPPFAADVIAYARGMAELNARQKSDDPALERLDKMDFKFKKLRRLRDRIEKFGR